MTKKRKRWAETGMIDGESELTAEHIKTLRSKNLGKFSNKPLQIEKDSP
jgi:hypothetical protein